MLISLRCIAKVTSINIYSITFASAHLLDGLDNGSGLTSVPTCTGWLHGMVFGAGPSCRMRRGAARIGTMLCRRGLPSSVHRRFSHFPSVMRGGPFPHCAAKHDS